MQRTHAPAKQNILLIIGLKIAYIINLSTPPGYLLYPGFFMSRYINNI